MRQALRDVTGVVEAVGALRSLGGEDALIEMAMFAQSHEPTVERAWRALAECEDAARRALSAPLGAGVSPVASVAPGPGVLAESSPPPSASVPPRASLSSVESVPPLESVLPASMPPSMSGPASEVEAALATDPAPQLALELASELPALEMPAADIEPAPADAEVAEAAPVDVAVAAEGEEEGPVTQVDAPPSRVLVVDDDPAVLRAFRRVLQADHEIVTARDGSEALQIVLSGARVDAIICDIGMPKLDGPAFFSELFELRPQLMPRVVFCTGGQPNEKTQRFLERLQAPLLYKPVAAADLQRAIDVARTR